MTKDGSFSLKCQNFMLGINNIHVILNSYVRETGGESLNALY